ncbi:MAG: hypothetical protein R3F54_00320 [Alphaproteobacteria bacterium]
MTSLLLMIVVALMAYFFADSIFTPLILLLWKKFWLLALQLQALFTKKNVLQALVQSFLLTTKALFRLVNKTVTAWLLPLLLTRRQRYWLHENLVRARRWIRMRLLRGWVRYRRLPPWGKAVVLAPAIMATIALFVASGFLLATLFGVAFIVPWIGGLPAATVLFLRQQLARAALFTFERLGLGPVISRLVDWAIDLVWWRTPEPMQQRFDAWWRRFKMQLRRRVIGPRRQVVKRVSGFGLGGTAPEDPSSAIKDEDPAEGSNLAQRRDRAEPDLGLAEQPAPDRQDAAEGEIARRARLDALEDRGR